VRLAASALLLTLAAVGCGGEGAGADPSRQLRLDEGRGTFDGVRLGDSQRQVRQRLGSTPCADGVQVAPRGKSFNEIGGPEPIGYRTRGRGAFDQCVMRYAESVFTVVAQEGVTAIITIDPRARTRRGIGVGDTAELVKQRYRQARCQSASDVDDGEVVSAVCTVPRSEIGRSGRALRLSFGLDSGGDKVRSIWLEARSWRTPDRLPPR